MPEALSETVPVVSRSEIESRARDVLRRHKLTTIPIDPVVLAQKAGIKVNNAKFTDDNLVGMIVKQGDDVTMLVNQSDPPFWKRSTIAHELGHYFLHLLQDGEYLDEEANLFRQQSVDEREMTPERRQEVQANMFAAALLMPEIEVRAYWEERRSVKELARIFRVSDEVMGYRIASLGLE